MSSKRRKIVAVTGARSEYDILFPVLKALRPDTDLSLIVTGAHLSSLYGNSLGDIASDGIRIESKLYSLVNTDHKIGRIVSLGYQIPLLAHAFEKARPDMVLVVGDREEAISVTMTAAFMGIPAAHMAGGDVVYDGNIDNSVRYAASKFAHIHLAFHAKHAENLRKLGEESWRVFNVGNPALDKYRSVPKMSRQKLFSEIGCDIPSGRYMVLIYHPIVTKYGEEERNVRNILDAVERSREQCFISYPNSDPGNFKVISTIEKYCKRNAKFFAYKNLGRNAFINLMRGASCLLGNSSMGMLETASLGLPTLNIGSRQVGRLHGDNLIFASGSKESVFKGLTRCLTDIRFINRAKNTQNPFGDGRSAHKIARILRTITLSRELIYKNITY